MNSYSAVYTPSQLHILKFGLQVLSQFYVSKQLFSNIIYSPISICNQIISYILSIIISNPGMNITYFLSLLFSLLLPIKTQTSIDATLSISLSNAVVQEMSDYTFNLVLVFNDPLVIGSLIQIYFPTQYVSNSTTTYDCQLTNWPFLVSSPIQCKITNRILTLSGAFTQQFEIVEDTTFEFIVKNVVNPVYAGQTSVFSGSIVNPSLVKIVGISQEYITIVTGSLSAQLTVSPAIVSTTADMIVVITTSHPLPGNARLRLYTSSNTWNRANSIAPETIFGSSPSCNSVNNTPSNLYCDMTGSFNERIITIYNINNYGSLQSPTSVTLTFKLSSIRTAPTTQPQGSFSLTVLNAQSKSIDSSLNNKIGGLSPKQIMNPSLTLSTTVVGQLAVGTLTLGISSIIETSDVFNIQIPNVISLNSLTRISVQSTQIPTFSISGNVISFTGVQVVTSIPITIILSQIINPEYVVDVSTLGSVFKIWTSRNGYKIDEIVSPFTYSTTAGLISSTGPTVSISQAGSVSNYTLTLNFQHGITRQYWVQIVFPSSYFKLTTSMSPSLSCTSSLSSICTLTPLADNFLKISNIIASNNANKYNTVTLMITNVVNPLQIGAWSGLQIYSYNSGSYLVDKNDAINGFIVTARIIEASRISMSTTSNIVYSLTDITLVVRTNNPISPNSYLQLSVPIQLQNSALVCTPTCLLLSTSTYYIYQIDVSSFYVASSPSTITLVLSNIRNPKSTRPTQSFQIKIFQTSTNNQLELISTGLQYRLCTVPTTLALTLTRTSTMNSNSNTKYLFEIGLAFTYSLSQTVVASIEIPSQLTCSSCIIQSSSSNSYTTSVSKNPSNSNLLLSPSCSIQIFLLNNPTFEPQSIKVTMLTNDKAYKIGTSTLTVINDVTNAITLSYNFQPSTQQYLSTKTTIVFNSITVKFGGFSYLQVGFGAEWDASMAVLASGASYYDISVISSTLVRITKKTNTASTTIDAFSLSDIVTPNFVPSSSVYLQTYSSTYKADRIESFLTWTTSCTLPCKQCSSTSSSTCQSCYSDSLLVMSRTLLFLNGTNNTCLSQCPDLYYLKTSTNSCEPCSSSCGNCNQFSICTSCPSSLPYILTLSANSSICYSTCPNGYFPSTLTVPSRCMACAPQRHCQSCSDLLTCNSCQSNYFLFLQQCQPTCPALTTISNQYTWNCDACPSNCSTCQRDTSATNSLVVKCTTCLSGYLLDGTRCYTSCQTYGLVPDTLTATCTTCQSSCLTCSLAPYNCLSCNTTSSSRYFLNNRCLSSCPNGYYAQNQFFLCVPCNGPCQYCTSSSISSCLSCISGYSKYGTVCRNACPTGYYQNGSQCVQCQTQCQSCQTEALCLTCNQNYTLFVSDCLLICPDGYVSVNRICLQCSSNCKTCSLVNFCTSCYSSMFLYNGLCVNPCPSKFYEEILVCSSCPFQCSECESTVVCNSCVSGYELVITSPTNKTCQSLCNAGYVPINAVCEQCAVGCQTCVYATNNCTTCATSYYFYQNILTNSSFAFINLCYASCPISLFTYRTSLTCLTSCPAKTYQSLTYSPTDPTDIISKQCIDCSSLCLTCSSSSVCLSCVGNASFYNSMCYSTCPPAAPFSVNLQCKTCNVVQCYQCIGTVCTQCYDGYLLINSDGVNSCVQTCGENMLYNISAYKCQSIANNTNSTNSSNSTGTIKFIPLPFCIVGAVGVPVILALNWIQNVQIYTSFFGLFGFLLFASLVTGLSVLAANITTTLSIISRLLQDSISFGSLTSHKILIALAAAAAIMVLINILCGLLYFCKVRTKVYRIVGFASILFSCKLIGGLLCSGYYGINMKNIKSKQQQAREQERRQDNFAEQIMQRQLNKNERYVNRGRSIYARTATSKLSHQSNFNILQYQKKQNSLPRTHSNKKTHSQAVDSNNGKKIDKGNEKLGQNNLIEVDGSKQSQKISKQIDKPLLIDPIESVKSQALNQDGIQQQNKRQKSSKSQEYKKIKQDTVKVQSKQVSKKSQLANSQSINSSFYKASQIQSLPNPTLSKTLPKFELRSVIQDEYLEQSVQKISDSAQQNIKFSALKINHSVQEIRNQYNSFWVIYDRIVMIYLPIDILLIVCGAMLCFNFTNTDFQFYSGIQLIIFAILDLVLTGLWRIWDHRLYQHQEKANSRRQKYQLRFEESSSILSALSKQKLYPQEEVEQEINEKMFVKHENDDLDIEFSQIVDNKKTKTEIYYPENAEPQTVSNNQQKEYKSQYARPIDVIKLKNQQIQQAINTGVYRHNKKSLAERQFQQDQQSKLDSAQKFNRAQQQQKQKVSEQQIPGQSSNKRTQLQSKTKNGDITKNNKNKQKMKGTEQANKVGDVDSEIEAEIEEKQVVNQIIFQNFDEESMDTHMDENDDDQFNAHGDSSVKKRKDSLGSQKEVKNQSKLTITPVVQAMESAARSPQRQESEIQTYQPPLQQEIQTSIITHRKPQHLLHQQASKEYTKYTNIFETNPIQEEEDRESEIQIGQPLKKPHSQQLEVVDLKNVYRNKIQPQKGRSIETKPKGKSRIQPKVIYADLDSVGTVSQFDIADEGPYHEQEQRYAANKDFSKMKNYEDMFDHNEDMARPSNFINTNFTYHNRAFLDSSLPQKLPANRPKKVSKKTRNQQANKTQK